LPTPTLRLRPEGGEVLEVTEGIEGIIQDLVDRDRQELDFKKPHLTSKKMFVIQR
jgi:hypothetical protein